MYAGTMHSLIFINKAEYAQRIEDLTRGASNTYDKTCYISFNDPFSVVVNFLERTNDVDESKFIVVDASSKKNEPQTVNQRTYTIPTQDLFKTYLMLRQLIMQEHVDHMLLDSISALIDKFGDFPLKRMLSDLLLEVGSWKCDTSLVMFHEHQDHEVRKHLSPFVGKNTVL